MAIGRMTKPATVLHMQDENEADQARKKLQTETTQTSEYAEHVNNDTALDYGTTNKT